MITTQRLEIRPWELKDAQAFYELSNDPGFTLFPITDYRQSDLKAAENWIVKARQVNAETGLGKWAVWERDTDFLLGMGGLTPWELEGEKLVDLTYRFCEAAWGKGLGWELARALVEFGFKTRGLDQITATITPENAASKRIAAKLGMKFDRKILLLGVVTDLYRLYR